MQFMSRILLSILLLAALIPIVPAAAQPAEKRIALVIGNASYQAGALTTAANDAGLIAQTLQAAGFDVSGARDLDQDSLRRAIRDFLDKAAASGPNTVAVDAARAHPFAKSSAPLASGLALIEPEPGMLIAFNAAPGTVAPEGKGAYGPYAQALAEMIREGGLTLPDVFNRTRLRVNEVT